jgi:hypothetical protein
MEIEKQVIGLYLSGIGSTTICKLLPINKQKVLKIIKDNNLLRNRLLSEDFYNNFWFENNKWCGFYHCNNCNSSIKFCVNKKSLLNRNLKKKSICKPCSLKMQVGSGNPFYNKKHTKETINKISKTKTGVSTSDHMKQEKYREMVRKVALKTFSNPELKKKLSLSLKERIAKGELKSYNRSKAEDELISYLRSIGLEVIPNFLIESKIFDLYIPKFNLLIEYNGDYWHCNPKKYQPNYINKKKNKTAKEIWEYDKNKIDLARKNNYSYEVIWELDYKKDKSILKNIITKYENKHY